MKYRSQILTGLAAILAVGYFIRVQNEDTLPKAANRLGNAILASDTDTIWSFVPEDERAFYHLDKERFAKFWLTLIEPKIKDVRTFSFNPVGSTGLEVVFETPNSEHSFGRAGWLVSGQLGSYYVPYMISYSSLNAASFDPHELRVDKFVRFEKYIRWIDQNRAALENLGLGSMRRGRSCPNGQTLAQIRRDFVHAETELKMQVTVATR